MSLLDRHVGFVGALRTAGLPVSVAEDLAAAEAVQVLGMSDRGLLRDGYAATLVKRHTDRAAFDTLFDLWFPARTGGSDPSEAHGDVPPAHRPRRPLRDDPELAEFRERLSDALLQGDESELAALADAGVTAFGGVPGRAKGSRSWSRHAALTAISPQTLLAGLLREALQGTMPDGAAPERRAADGFAQRLARTTMTARIARFEQLVGSEVQRRLAEQSSPEEVARHAVRPGIDRIDLSSAGRADLVALRREVVPLARRLAARLAVEQRRGRSGRLDMRRTIRASLASGGVPLDTVHRPRRPHRTDLVVLCDVSESVTSFAHFTLLLVFALREQFSRVRVFAFIDDLDEVTGHFAPGRDVGEAVTSLATGARVRSWYGRTDYARALGLFAERHLDALTPRSSLLVLGDARSNHGASPVPPLRRLVERSRRAYWLNPERRSAWDTGDSVAGEVAAVLPMVECRNLAQLSAFVRDLV